MSHETARKLARLVDAHRDLYTSLLHLCEALDPAQWEIPTGCPGWRVRDVFAHVVGLEAVLAGEPEPAHTPAGDLAHVRTDLGRYMELHVDARRGAPVEDLLLEARDLFSRRLGQLELVTDLEAELVAPRGSTTPAYRLLPIRVFDLWAHEQDIRRAVDLPGHLDGPAPEISLGRILKGLAAVLGRDETLTGTLELDVTGPLARSVTIELGDGAPGGTVRLAMPFPDLVARACGRSDAPAPDLVLIEGDTELGMRILERFAITP